MFPSISNFLNHQVKKEYIQLPFDSCHEDVLCLSLLPCEQFEDNHWVHSCYVSRNGLAVRVELQINKAPTAPPPSSETVANNFLASFTY